jgi:uncharacterized DUF497 family protein
MPAEATFDWDDANAGHLANHDVTIAEFEQVIRNDPMLFDYDDVDGEERWTGVGATNGLRVLIVAFTTRGGRIRAVTGFNASKRKAREFWKRKGN